MKKGKRPRDVPKFEGDRCEFVKSLKSKYDPEVWSERMTLLDGGKKLSKENDALFGNDKDDDGKRVCVKCWKMGHSASRCHGGFKKRK